MNPANVTVAREFADPAMDALLELEAAARVLDLEDWIIERLRHPELEATFHLLLHKENGQALTVPVLHIEHNTALGLACGQLTLATDPFLGQLRAESMQASWRHALFGLPFGGGATAVLCDPRGLRERELKAVAREFSELEFSRAHVLYQGSGMNPCIAGWMHRCGKASVCGATGALGGVAQDSVIGIAVCELARHWFSRKGEKLSGKRVAVQGFGSVGTHVAENLYRAGARIVAVADVSGGLTDPLGMNAEALSTYVHRNEVLLGYENAESATNADVLECECDVLVLADGVRQLNEENADRVKARFIIECVPEAVSVSAARILAAREVELLPEIMAGAGAAISAYVEYIQRGEVHWTAAHRDAFVRRIFRRVMEEVGTARAKWNVTVRHAALALGVQKVAEALRSQVL